MIMNGEVSLIDEEREVERLGQWSQVGSLERQKEEVLVVLQLEFESRSLQEKLIPL